ncbi:hypothetical protein ACFFLM_06110 [Deinococcus oregonensis]|uniref:Uncharacterized protein n=1 Tax=Deinococcus oregonensis TaxID=1805970 RepID=A0ABV6AVU2_9DEIO
MPTDHSLMNGEAVDLSERLQHLQLWMHHVHLRLAALKAREFIALGAPPFDWRTVQVDAH